MSLPIPLPAVPSEGPANPALSPRLPAAGSSRPRRLPIRPMLLLLTICLFAPAPFGRSAAALPAPGDEAISSYILSLSQPSLHQTWLEAGGRAPSADETRARALRMRAELDAAELRIAAEQSAVAAVAEQLGIAVIDRYEAVMNGLLIHATAAQLDALQSREAVGAIRRAPLLRPQLSRSVPHIGADRVAQALGYDGDGVTIAVIDAGIDYTHTHFGGPGTRAAYARASLAAEVIDDSWNGRRLFPTETVIGGWDFVGPLYTNPAHCSEAQERAGRCRRSPDPDPDPLDQHGHGSHVAGIAAGHMTGTLASGVAPGAKLVALKIYGPPESGIYVDEEVDVVISALDWCARVNLGRSVEGTPSERVDVINMSLGEPYGQGAPLFDDAIAALAEQGVIVVASAGNEGNTPYVHGAPGASRGLLSVANTAIDGEGDQISGSSSRGPGRDGGLKPSLSAPGSGIRSTAYGTGDQSRTLSGTSMSAPHVAGAAALMIQRNRVENLGLGALDLAALLMNYASPAVLEGNQIAPVTRQGAGRVDVYRAASASIVARSGGIADLGLGFVPVTGESRQIERTVQLHNVGAEDRYLLAEAVFHRESAGKGLRIALPEEPVRVPAGDTIDLPVEFQFDADALQAWSLRERPADASQLDRLELDGQLRLRDVDAEGQPAPGLELGLPFLALPRRASAISGRLARSGGPAAAFENAGRAGSVQLYALPSPPPGMPEIDADEPAVLYELDLAGVGLRFELGPADAPQLRMAIVSHEAATLAGMTITEIYLDSDDDGVDDWRLRHGALAALGGGGPGGQMGLAVAAWDPVTLSILGGETLVPAEVVDLHSQVSSFSLPLSQIGMNAPGPLSLGLLRRGITEDWLHGPDVDQAPDGALPPAALRYRLDPGAWSHAPATWTLDLEGGSSGAISLLPVDGAPTEARLPRLLAIYPDNAIPPEGRQAQVLEFERAGIWLPMLVNGR